MSFYHTPVLFELALARLGVAETPGGVFVDATFGGGGHSQGVLDRLASEGRLIAFDQDPDAYANALADARFELVPVNFRFLKREWQRMDLPPLQGILADLGVSSYQFDNPARGFSHRFEAPLDMRMAPDAPLATGGPVPTAAQLLAEAPEDELYRIFSRYGEFSGASRLAKAVVARRSATPIRTTGDLVELVDETLGTPAKPVQGILAQVFQALRIAVNDELGALETLLTDAKDVLAPGGRLVVISYHSLEDRLVKHLFQTGSLSGERTTDFYGNPLNPWQPLSKKPEVPPAEEIQRNPRARSAKLRAAVYWPNQAQPKPEPTKPHSPKN